MNITIIFCVAWNYEPRALRVREDFLLRVPTARIDLEKGGVGDFEIVIDGVKCFSKHKKGRFPTYEETIDLIAR